jgi:hypothetical protein
LGEIGTNMPHGLGKSEPPGMAGPAGVAGLEGAAGHAPWLVPGPMHLLSRGHNLDERDPQRKRRFNRID